MADEKTTSAKLVDNVLLTLVARCAMIIATPLTLMMGQRAINNIDEISKKIDIMREQAIETSADIRALRVELAEQERTLADHEARVRMIEARMPRGEPAGRN